MKAILLFFAFVAAVVASPQADASVTNAPAFLELHDQFNVVDKLSFPATKVTILTIADWKGSRQVSGWVMPVKQQFGARIDIRGIADLSCVPRPLRDLVQRRFRAAQTYSVMMDWTGRAVKLFAYAPGKVDVLVLDQRGRIVYRAAGEADARAVHELCSAIGQALSSNPQKSK